MSTYIISIDLFTKFRNQYILLMRLGWRWDRLNHSYPSPYATRQLKRKVQATVLLFQMKAFIFRWQWQNNRNLWHERKL